jgi:peptidoglycan/LPS O-acetylase OafA/YrhL
MPELNSLRGLACLSVLFFHGLWWYIPASATGVERLLRNLTADWHRGVGFFFVLSGLLITGILRDSCERPDYFSRFYKRRALRILPAYYMMLVLLAIFGVRITREFLGLSALYLANMAPLLGVFMGYGPLWSLAVEEQFYLIWPAFVRRFSNRTIVFISVGLFLNSIILTLGLHTSSPQATFPIWYAAHGLALGDVLAVYLRSRWASPSNVRNVAALFSLAGSVMVWLSHAAWLRRPVGMAFECGWDFLFAAALLFALLVGTSRFEAWTHPRWLQFFGDISYGLYLVHVLVFTVYRRLFHPGDDLVAILTQFSICFTASIALATLSRFTVEEWFLNLKDKPFQLRQEQVIVQELAPPSAARRFVSAAADNGGASNRQR